MSAAPLRWRAKRHPWHRSRRLQLRDKECLDPHWLALLDAENVQTVILSRHEDFDLLRLLHRSPRWVVDFAGHRSVILVRRGIANVVELG